MADHGECAGIGEKGRALGAQHEAPVGKLVEEPQGGRAGQQTPGAVQRHFEASGEILRRRRTLRQRFEEAGFDAGIENLRIDEARGQIEKLAGRAAGEEPADRGCHGEGVEARAHQGPVADVAPANRQRR